MTEVEADKLETRRGGVQCGLYISGKFSFGLAYYGLVCVSSCRVSNTLLHV